ncbi:VOC family protein [Naasia lichenicola]|uniref:Glyoxalase n=1 Tax=Naasia lichenicola TaxID=2565933 RepID=A0A4S4FQ72_9MICO|nr:VOC family protein [Naasia lichenicola]THG31516.1 glyoxalase [Naasia lichenicola]
MSVKPERVILEQTAAAGTLRDTAVSHIGLRVPEVQATADFYGRVLGLVVQRELADGGLQMGWGTGHHVLDLLPGERSLAYYAFEVRDAGGMAGIRSRLEQAGAPVTEVDPALLDASIGDVESIETTDPDGNTVQFHSAVWRQGEGAGDPGRRPVKYQHITLGTVDVAPMTDWFTGVIGFRISDQLEDGRFAWMRSNKDHHTLAIVNVGARGNVDHYSFDLAEWEDFKSWCDKLTEQDVDVAWGPGRHGPGNNLFVFFDDPAGNHIELSAEMEKFYDDRVTYVARRWNPIPQSVNLWGGQLPNWRRVSGVQS